MALAKAIHAFDIGQRQPYRYDGPDYFRTMYIDGEDVHGDKPAQIERPTPSRTQPHSNGTVTESLIHDRRTSTPKTLSPEIIELIASNLSHIDLACFRAVNRRLSHIIGIDNSWTRIHYKVVMIDILSHRPELLSRAVVPGPKPPGVCLLPREYTHYTRWAIMCRWERDLDMTKETMLCCWKCKKKHLRTEFAAWAAEVGLDINKCAPEERLCKAEMPELFPCDRLTSTSPTTGLSAEAIEWRGQWHGFARSTPSVMAMQERMWNCHACGMGVVDDGGLKYAIAARFDSALEGGGWCHPRDACNLSSWDWNRE